jgi:hypothetical protein
MTVVLFPSIPMRPREVDPDFATELEAARDVGLATALVDHTRVAEGDPGGGVAMVVPDQGTALYRGWMLSPADYEAMFRALQERGISLLNTPRAYRVCHLLPESYPWIAGHTPKSVWTPLAGNDDLAQLAALLVPFGHGPVVVKDYVKSQKHYWAEACFIPASDDLAAVQRVVRRFLDLQGEDLSGGLVFREYVPLKIIGTHPKSGMPLAAEFRVFWLDSEPIVSHPYWGGLASCDMSLPFDELRPIAAGVPSRFFTMDVAFLEQGGWTIIELGDGQVAGLPSHDLAPEFFRRISAKVLQCVTA